MAITSTVRLTMLGELQGQSAQNHFDWYAEAEHKTISGGAVITAFYNDVFPGILAQLSEEYTCLAMKGWYSDFTQTDPPVITTAPINEVGLITDSDPLPSYCTVNITLIPANFTKFPATNTGFRPGFRGFSGATEGQQDNGLLTAGAITLWNAVGESLETLSVDAGGGQFFDYTLGMVRESQVVAERTYVLVAETDVKPIIGTRLTRKRRPL